MNNQRLLLWSFTLYMFALCGYSTAYGDIAFGEGTETWNVKPKQPPHQLVYQTGWRKLDGFAKVLPATKPTSADVVTGTSSPVTAHVVGARGWNALDGFPARHDKADDKHAQIRTPGRALVPTSELVALLREAHQKTGLRPAYLMGLLHVETSLGANVGTGRYHKDMNPAEHGTFLRITQRLGLDSNRTPVSQDPGPGWGGAMGLAQFIPSTWMRTESCVRAHTGNQIPSPWNTRDAVFAAACLLKSLGGVHSEERAARMYYAGDNWNLGIAAEYADKVLRAANQYTGYFVGEHSLMVRK